MASNGRSMSSGQGQTTLANVWTRDMAIAYHGTRVVSVADPNDPTPRTFTSPPRSRKERSRKEKAKDVWDASLVALGNLVNGTKKNAKKGTKKLRRKRTRSLSSMDKSHNPRIGPEEPQNSYRRLMARLRSLRLHSRQQ